MNMRYFGSIPAGDVMAVSLRNRNGIQAEIITLGAALRSLVVPCADGSLRDIVLGYGTAEEYLNGRAYFGATVGRFCNRIAGASFELDGKRFGLDANEGENQLHGGRIGFSHRIWTPIVLSESEALFRLESPDGEMGYPGNVSAEVRYRLTDDNALSIRYKAQSDRKTVLSLTNHSYFNLAGHGSGPVTEHFLRVAADSYTPAGPGLIPTGEIRKTDGTWLDLREKKRLGDILGSPEGRSAGGLDHNYVLSAAEPVQAELTAPDGRLSLEVLTDRPAIQVYTAGGLGETAGKDGARYRRFQGVCLETQGFPDAVHHDNFPSAVLEAGQLWETETVYRISGELRPGRKRQGIIIHM